MGNRAETNRPPCSRCAVRLVFRLFVLFLFVCSSLLRSSSSACTRDTNRAAFALQQQQPTAHESTGRDIIIRASAIVTHACDDTHEERR